MAEAQSKDYTVVLHFSAGLRDRIIAASGTVHAAMVTAQHRKKFLKRGTLYDHDNAYLNAAQEDKEDAGEDDAGADDEDDDSSRSRQSDKLHATSAQPGDAKPYPTREASDG